MQDFEELGYDFIKTTVVGVGRNAAEGVALMAGRGLPHLNCVVAETSDLPDLAKNVKIVKKNKIDDELRGADVVFLLASMADEVERETIGVIADSVKKSGAYISLGIVDHTETVDGKNTTKITHLEQTLDAVIALATGALKGRSWAGVACQIVHSIYSLYAFPGLIGLDIADVKAVLTNGGQAFVGIGEIRLFDAGNEDTAYIAAAELAINDPIMAGKLPNARRILLIVSGSNDKLSLFDVHNVVTRVYEAAHSQEEFIFGASLDDGMADKITVTLVATDIR